jgi:uncharacterized peroxidase-related enzyme
MAPSSLATIEWGECIVPTATPPSALAAEVRAHMGMVPEWVGRLAPVPWVARAAARFSTRPLAHAPIPLCELISLVVSQDNSCRFCYGTQRAFLKVLGYGDDYIDRLERNFQLADLTPAERAALVFARKVSHANPRPDRTDYDALLRLGFSRPAVAELACTAAFMTFANRLTTLLAFPPSSIESIVDGRLFKLIRPVVAWYIRPRARRPELLPTPNPEPCASVVAALEGSPSARALREVIDDAWASPVLPARSKLLLLAVVARAVGCARSEAEARAALAAGGLAGAEVDDILTNLTSPRLDRREALLVPFARETIRFSRPLVVQERMQELARQLSTEETLEAVGIMALANAVTRLSVLLDLC